MAQRVCSKEALLPFLGMMIVVLAQVSNMFLTKIALSKGMNKYVLIVYSDTLSGLVLFPFCFLFHRSDWTSITFPLLCKFFVLSVFGIAAQIFGYAGIEYSSPTLGSAILNLIPAFTFILAVVFRLEKLDWRSKSSIAKAVGTIVSIAGALVVTFYKGSTPSHVQQLLYSPQTRWILGGFFFAGQALMDSAWYILQAFVLRKFHAVVIIIFFIRSFNAIQSAIFASFVVKDTNAWKLSLDIKLVSILYAGVIGLALRISLVGWCLSKTGPVYVSMFKPLSIIFAVIMDAIIFGNMLSLGSFIGAIIIVSGFYAVMWGKANEQKTNENCAVRSSKSSEEKVPLLQNRVEGT